MYTLGDLAEENAANDEFQTMGFYKHLEAYQPYEQQINDVGIAYRTTSLLLKGKTYNAEETAKLGLPNQLKGAAFKDDETGEIMYVLWARTRTDQSEYITGSYSFPEALRTERFLKYDWDYGQTNEEQTMDPANVPLNGTPIFLTPSDRPADTPEEESVDLQIYPNPIKKTFTVSFAVGVEGPVSIDLLNAAGQYVHTFVEAENFPGGLHQRDFQYNANANGLYFIRIRTKDGEGIHKVSFMGN